MFHGIGSYGSALTSNSFLSTEFGVSSEYIGNNQEQALKALEQGYPILGSEDGHFLAIIPAPDEDKEKGYKFYIIDSARGHDGAYKTVADANKVVKGNLELNYIIYP